MCALPKKTSVCPHRSGNIVDRLIDHQTMDIIHFSPTSSFQGVLFRKQKEHKYIVGEEEVTQITSIEYPLIFSYKLVTIDNMTGYFLDMFRTKDMNAVVFSSQNRFQCKRQIFHLHGTLSVFKQVVHFKGCHGHDAITQIASDIGLQHGGCKVYMVLLTGVIGTLVDVQFGCYIERYFLHAFQTCIKPRIRIIDLHPVIYLELHSWDTAYLPDLPSQFRPKRIVITVSNKGTVIFRVTWGKTIVWSKTVEKHIVEACQWIMDKIKECC